ncbi:MAG: PadR family transcriptional regulator [Thalassotalea sp.]|nr:PadR family transcriptional regulator [Thalassotalea sp.]
MKYSKDFVAASTTPLILAILKQGKSYGYAIIQQVKELSNGEMEWADGMLYPILHRLQKKEFIEAVWGVSETGRKRKYYLLSVLGEKELFQQRDNWQQLNSMLNQLIGDSNE